MRLIWSLAGGATLLVSFPGGAAEPLALEPSSHWQLNYDRGSCRLSRTFGEGDNQVLAHFIRYTPSPAFEVLLVGEPIDGRNAPLEYSYLPSGAKQDTHMAMFGETQDGRPTLFLTYQFQDVPGEGNEMASSEREALIGEDIRRITGLRVSRSVETEVDLRLSGFAKAMQAMDVCLEDLASSWGFDDEKRAQIAKGAVALNPEEWAKNIDYPDGLLFRDSRGKVTLKFVVEESGRATECEVLDEAYSSEFGDTACKGIMEVARFEPALDANSKPVASFYVSTIRFVMPEIEKGRRLR